MSVAVIGRTRWLLDAAKLLVERNVPIGLVVTAKEEEFYQCRAEEFESFADRIDAPYAFAPKLNDKVGVRILEESGCAVAVSANWPTVLGAAAIGSFPQGILNAHAGDLPRYRGNACPNWAILNGEDRIGLSIHLMEAGALDSGPVVRKDYLAVSDATYIADVYAWLDKQIPQSLTDVAQGIMDGVVVPEPQPTDAALALRCFPRRPEDGKIDWRQSAELVHRLVRASSRPFSGAFCSDEEGRKITIWRADRFEHPGPFLAVPGQVMLRDGDAPVIACGAGCLKLMDVEVDGISDPSDARKSIARSLRARLL